MNDKKKISIFILRVRVADGEAFVRTDEQLKAEIKLVENIQSTANFMEMEAYHHNYKPTECVPFWLN